MDQAARFRGYPQAIRTDNGPEFTAEPSWPGCRREVSSTSSFNLAVRPRTLTSRASTANSEMNASTSTDLNPWLRLAKSLLLGVRTTTRFGHTEPLNGFHRLNSQPNTETPTHQTKQDRLTCKPLGLSTTDWYGYRGQVNGGIDIVAISGKEGELIQCKSSIKADLGWDAIKEVTGGAARYQAQFAGTRLRKVAVTNQGFNATAIEQAAVNQVELITRRQLEELLGQHPVSNLELDEALLNMRG